MAAASAAKSEKSEKSSNGSSVKIVKIIRQEQLAKYRDAVVRLSELKKNVEIEEEKVEASSVALCELVRRGCSIEKGELTGRIEVRAGRRVPRYKDWILSKHGEEVVEQILKETPKGEDSEKFEVIRVIG
jgi:hypothetical protein